ncbi:SGNH hydrolase-type esterase domain-containing protein [Limtongia smithiae]|uniref:SGNH hydrolase-type esterase domain-containing protein n=1 Tax=Limtongia smithiae TaxID=1125753 RepID=UPI0034CF3888
MQQQQQYKKIILLGDSQFELSWNPALDFCLPGAIASLYARRADVLNRGLSGYSSPWLRSQFDRVLEELGDTVEPLMFILWLGTNDACIESTPHHVPVVETVAMTREYVSAIRARWAHTAILLVTPAPVSIAKMETSPLRSKGTDRTQRAMADYAQMLLDACAEGGVLAEFGVMPVNLFEAGEQIGKFTIDGLHFNGQGYRILFNLLRNVFDSEPTLSPASLSGVEPGWAVKARQLGRTV